MAEKEYIERGALHRAIEEAQIKLESNDDKVWSRNKPYYKGLAMARAILNEAPAAVVEVRHGRWKKVYQNKIATVYECSNCQHLSFGTSEYCICGAKMDGERKD